LGILLQKRLNTF